MDEPSYCALYLRYLELLQKYEPRAKSVHLLFAPIGTNVMFLAYRVWVNAARGIRTEIRPGHYQHDKRCIEVFNEKHSRDASLDPWILQRYDGHHDHPKPWEIWFRALESNDAKATDFRSIKKHLQLELAEASGLPNRKALELGICLQYVTRFNPETLQFAKKHDKIEGRDAIAVHIRRGDACSEDLEKADPNRDNHHLYEYVVEIEKYRSQGYQNFYILTESQREIDLLRNRFDGNCNILSADLERRNFVRIPESVFNQAFFVEYQCLDNPAFAKFLMESALIDMYNARQCVGFIGTFSSQFSVTNWLNMTGFHERSIPVSNLSPVPFDTHFHGEKWTFARFRIWLAWRKRLNRLCARMITPSNLAQAFRAHRETTGKQAILVLRERDVGFFSLFLQVVNTLLVVEEEKLDCSVFVEFGENQAYFQNTNTWLDYFNEIPNQQNRPSTSQLRLIDQEYDKRTSQVGCWDEEGVVYSTEPGVFWTASFYPNLKPGAHSRFISHHGTPSLQERVRASQVIEKYLLPRIETQKEFNRFKDQSGIEGYVIGVQFRGTDAREDHRRMIPSYEVFFEAVEDQLKGRDDDPVIVVASDEQAFVRAIENKFRNVKSYHAPRHQAGDQYKGEGPQGAMMPKFVTENTNAALKGVVMDYMLICLADVLIHNVGSVSNSALLTNPQIRSIRLGPNVL